jgi:hypothetical protein
MHVCIAAIEDFTDYIDFAHSHPTSEVKMLWKIMKIQYIGSLQQVQLKNLGL